MDSPANAYTNFHITGPVSIDRVDKVTHSHYRTILIMGPTGSGKSTFIEALGMNDDRKISSNQLEGFTQTVSTYRLNGVTWLGDPIYIVDSPGFADTKISELAIVLMLQRWIKENGGKYFSRILYLTPITHVRLPGSQRQVLKTFQALTDVQTAGGITLVTTTWDTIWGVNARKRAESLSSNSRVISSGRYSLIIYFGYIDPENIHKSQEYIGRGARIVKYHNTERSALYILNQAIAHQRGNVFSLEDIFAKGLSLQRAPFAANLYADLQLRIQNLQVERVDLQMDLMHAEAQADEQLRSVLFTRLEEVDKYAAIFQKELQDFESPSVVTTSHLPSGKIGWLKRVVHLCMR